MIRDDFNESLFQATFLSFLQQIFEKQMQADKIEMDLIRKFQGKPQCINSHLEIIKNCRKTVTIIDNLRKQAKNYFTDLKIMQVYVYFDSLFRMVVHVIKLISQCYLHRFQHNSSTNNALTYKPQDKKVGHKQNQLKFISDQDYHFHYLTKDDNRKLQYLDYMINNLENKQLELKNQMHMLITDLEDEKHKIYNIDFTIKNQMFQQMSNAFQDISHKAQFLFSNFLKGNFNPNSKNQMLDPNDIENQIMQKMRRQIKNTAKTKFQIILNKVTKIFKQKIVKKIELKQKQMHKLAKSMKKQKEQLFKSKKNLRGKSRKIIKRKNDSQASIEDELEDEKLIAKKQQIERLNKDIQCLKKQNKILNGSIEQMKQTLKKQRLEMGKIQFQNQQLQRLFKKKSVEFEQSKAELQWTIQKSARESTIYNLRKGQIQQNLLKKLKSQQSIKQNLTKSIQIQTQVVFQKTPIQQLFNSTLSYQHKTSLVSMNNKHRKMNSGPIDKMKDRKIAQLEHILKLTFQQMNRLVRMEHSSEEQRKISYLIDEGRYSEVLNKVKQKAEMNENKKKVEAQSFNVTSKKLKTMKKFMSTKKIKKYSSVGHQQFVHIGIQTDESKLRKKEQHKTMMFSSQNRSKMITIKQRNQKSQKKILHNKQNKKGVIPASQLIKKFNQQIIQKNGQQKGNELISRYNEIENGRFFSTSNVFNIQNNNLNGKKNIGDSTLFEQININRTERARFRRSFDLVSQLNLHNNGKPTQNKEKRYSKLKSTMQINGEQKNEQIQSQRSNHVFEIRKLQAKTNNDQVINGENENEDESNSQAAQKYEQLLMNVLMYASNELSNQKVCALLQKFKLSYPTTAEVSAWQ